MTNKKENQHTVQKTDISDKGNTENGLMPEDVIERKMFDFDAVRKETDNGTNDSYDSSQDVEVQAQQSEPNDKATQHSNHNTLDRRSNVQTQQTKSTDEECERECNKKDRQN